MSDIDDELEELKAKTREQPRVAGGGDDEERDERSPIEQWVDEGKRQREENEQTPMVGARCLPVWAWFQAVGEEEGFEALVETIDADELGDDVFYPPRNVTKADLVRRVLMLGIREVDPDAFEELKEYTEY